MDNNINQKKKSNIGVIILLVIIIVCLVGYIVYSNMLKDNKSSTNSSSIKSNKNSLVGENEENTNQVIEEIIAATDNSNQDNELNFSTLLEQLKDSFQVVYTLKNGSYAYCGNDASKSDKTDNIGNSYYLSNSYKSYDDLINSLKKYASENVLDINKENYIEENGNLYCKGYGKSNPYQPVDYIIQIEKMTDNNISATIAVELLDSNTNTYLYGNYKVEYTKTGVSSYWMISDYSSK